ncbi:MAG: Rieske 2Fe-2S domain-containing protein, partial [Acidimicrobiales bacterium]
FPSNEHIAPEVIAHPDYLYVSHLHRDHFDREFLRENVSRAATVLLPAFPVPDLRRELASLGFARFEVLPDRDPLDLDGLSVMGVLEVSTSDGPLGDSALAVDDGSARLLNQNDARPRNLEAIRGFGPYDAHFLQFSGAIWYPVVYEMGARAKAELGREKRVRGMDRALRFAQDVGARFVFPSAGPPCFLDDSLFAHNDFDCDESNPFPDQTVLLDYLSTHDTGGGRLLVPGSVVTLSSGGCELSHPAPDEQALAPFTDKRAYLEAYQARCRPAIQAARDAWPSGEADPALGGDVVGILQEWWEPLLAMADHICSGVGEPVLLQAGELAVVLDFPARQVRAHDGEACSYSFDFEPGPFLASVADRCEDWVNGLFLSMRFTAQREGPYNEHIYAFFKCLSVERMAWAENRAGAGAALSAPGEASSRRHRSPEDGWCQIDGWRIQRYCPHLQADLSVFGCVEDGVLSCQLHGWQFDLATGQCLTSEGSHQIKAERLVDTDL